MVTPRLWWMLLALLTAAVAVFSVAVTVWLDLHPCHLCILQRTVFFLLAPAALLAGWWRGGAAVFMALAAAGGGIAAYQSWLQWRALPAESCVASPLGPLEQLVEWLGQRFPALFLATGFCEDKQLTMLGLSLANWAFVLFLAVFFIGLWAWRAAARAGHRSAA